jgi:serine/threonine protein kinase
MSHRIDQLGPFVIDEQIQKRGDFGVYKATHKVLERDTLLKVYFGENEKLIKKFSKEARFIAKIKSPRIVQIYEFGQFDEGFYIALEYVSGCNLREFLNTNTLNEESTRCLADQIAHAVADVHHLGIVHGDLKPENILIDTRNAIKLTDFGLSFNREKLKGETREGLLGTMAYLSPEQISNIDASEKSDIFSLGVIFYELFCGQHPFLGNSFQETMTNIISKEPECPDDLSMVSELMHPIGQMLNKEPAERLTDLSVFYMEKTNDNASTEVTDLRQSATSSWYTYASVALVVIIVAVFLWQLPGDAANQMPSAEQKPLAVDTMTGTFADSLVKEIPQGQETRETPVLAEAPKNAGSNGIEPVADKPGAVEVTRVSVVVDPWAVVYINDEKIATTPLPGPLDLKPGRYNVKLLNPYYPEFTQQITIPEQAAYRLSYHLDSLFWNVDIQVIPWGKVYIDNIYYGQTPIKKPIQLSRGKHVLTVANEFYQTWRDTIEFAGHYHQSLKIRLKEKP